MTFSPRDTKDISGLVAKKLEWYLNVERREQRFDTQGYYRTTPKMQTIDLMYRMLDTTELDPKAASSPRQAKEPEKKKSPSRKSKSKGKAEKYKTLDTSKESDSRNGLASSPQGSSNKEGKEKKKPIHPSVVQSSRRVVSNKEAERLSDNANKIFEEQPLDKLQVIHRYRPHSSDIPPIVENGRVQNYSCHVGSALQAKNYVEFYMREGLQTGKKEYSKRLQRLGSKKGDTGGSEKGSQQGDEQTRSPSHRADKKM